MHGGVTELLKTDPKNSDRINMARKQNPPTFLPLDSSLLKKHVKTLNDERER